MAVWSLNTWPSVREPLVLGIFHFCLFVSSHGFDILRNCVLHTWGSTLYAVACQRSGVGASLRRLIRHQWRRRHLRSDRRLSLSSLQPSQTHNFHRRVLCKHQRGGKKHNKSEDLMLKVFTCLLPRGGQRTDVTRWKAKQKSTHFSRS